jgi:hypothetical protein
MLLATVLIDAAHPALEDAEHVLNGVGVSRHRPAGSGSRHAWLRGYDGS